MTVIGMADHIHLQTGVEGTPGGVFLVRGVTLIDKLFYCAPVAYHEAVVAPAFFQYLGQSVVIGRARRAADVVE